MYWVVYLQSMMSILINILYHIYICSAYLSHNNNVHMHRPCRSWKCQVLDTNIPSLNYDKSFVETKPSVTSHQFVQNLLFVCICVQATVCGYSKQLLHLTLFQIFFEAFHLKQTLKLMAKGFQIDQRSIFIIMLAFEIYSWIDNLKVKDPTEFKT